MAFRLLIECSKDIDELHINFSDGTSSVVEKPKELDKPKEPKIPKEHKEPKERKKLDTYLDTEEDYEITQEVVTKPEIMELNRPAKVSDELQNLDF